MLDLDQHSVSDLMQVRFWLETVGVQEAATLEPALGKGELARIRDALARLEEAAGNASEWIAADTVFHAAVVRSAGNPYLAAMYESVHTAVLSYEIKQWVDSESVPSWLRDATPEQTLDKWYVSHLPSQPPTARTRFQASSAPGRRTAEPGPRVNPERAEVRVGRRARGQEVPRTALATASGLAKPRTPHARPSRREHAPPPALNARCFTSNHRFDPHICPPTADGAGQNLRKCVLSMMRSSLGRALRTVEGVSWR
jgi:hypothetical protein